MELTYKSKKSAWSAFSIWTVLFFGIIIPVIFILVPTLLYTILLEPYNTGTISEDLVGIAETVKGIVGSIKEMLVGLGLVTVEVKTFGIMAGCIIGGTSFLLTVIITWVKIHRAKQTTYEFYDRTLVIKEGGIFTKGEENRRIFLMPGMSVSMKRTLKGKLFGYGDVVLSMGLGVAGEVVMENVKKPKKAKAILSKYTAEASSMPMIDGMGCMPWMMMGYPFFY